MFAHGGDCAAMQHEEGRRLLAKAARGPPREGCESVKCFGAVQSEDPKHAPKYPRPKRATHPGRLFDTNFYTASGSHMAELPNRIQART